MLESIDNDQLEENVTEIKTFTVPIHLGECKENINVIAHDTSEFSKEQIINQAIKFHLKGDIEEASKYYQYCLNKGFQDSRVLSNYGIILKDLGKLNEAAKSTQKAIELKPDFAKAHFNLGSILKDLGKLNEAEISTRKAIKLNPNYSEAYSNLGNILKDLGNLQDAELAQRKAIELNPRFAEAHFHLGNILKDLGNLQDAELEQRKAIELNPHFTNAFLNLGNLLIDLAKLKEAKQSYNKAIELDKSSAASHKGLSIYFYLIGNLDLALNSISKAYSLDPKDQTNTLLLSIFQEEKIRKEQKVNINHKISSEQKKILDSNPLILNRPVEKELIDTLYKIKAQDQAKYQNPTYGNAIGSNYKLFNRNEPMIKTIKDELTSISMNFMKSKIFIVASFFTIFRSGGGLTSHTHLNPLDSLNGLNLASKKYSLVYYLSVGDQNCDEPGILKLENPTQNILPENGLILIFPAGRKHSVFYKGKKDRIIIGVNFYKI